MIRKVIPIIFLLIFLVAIPQLPESRATFSSIVFVQKSGGVGGGTISCAFDNNVVIGNTIFVLIGGSSANGAVTDTLGSSFTQAKTFAASGATQGANAAIYYSILASGGPDTITVQHDSDNNGQGIFCLELSGGWTAGTIVTNPGTMSASTTTFSVPSTFVASGDTILVATGENACNGSAPVTPIFNASAIHGDGAGSAAAPVACNGGLNFFGSGGHFLSVNWGGGSSLFSGSMTSGTMITSNSANWAEIMMPLIPTSPGPQPTTIVGWNAPSAATLGHGLIALILVLMGMAFFGILPALFKYEGDFTITLMLIGATAGLVIATLPSNGTNSLAVPFGEIVLGAFLLILWLWKGGTGGPSP